MDHRGELRAPHLFASRTGGRAATEDLSFVCRAGTLAKAGHWTFVILEYPFVIYLAAPNFLAFDLRTCPESFRGKSASEVAKIDNGINNSLNEGPEAIRAKQSCQEPLMPRQAGRAANES
jgi:hypothetical protein